MMSPDAAPRKRRRSGLQGSHRGWRSFRWSFHPALLAVQNGQPPTTSARFDPTPRFIRNGRDLGEW
jgi:hypothetical protein